MRSPLIRALYIQISCILFWCCLRKLNGCNSQMLARITGNEVCYEARSTTSRFNVVKHVRIRRLRWIGQILRGDQNRFLFKAIETQLTMDIPVNLLMDAPANTSLEDLVTLAQGKGFWTSLEASIPSHLRGITMYNIDHYSNWNRLCMYPIYCPQFVSD